MIQKLKIQDRQNIFILKDKINEIIDEIKIITKKVNYLQPPKTKRFFRKNVYD